MDRKVENDSPGERIQEEKHWLQESPLTFAGKLDKDESHVSGLHKSIVYDKLVLHFCFFNEKRLHVFTKQPSHSSGNVGPVCVPIEVVGMDVDDPNDPRLWGQGIDTSIHDVVLSMLQDDVRSGVLRSVEFMDFMYDEPVVLSDREIPVEHAIGEHRQLDMAVMLSLRAGTRMPSYRTLVLPKDGRPPVYYKPYQTNPFTQNQAKSKVSQKVWSDLFTPEVLDCLFQRNEEFRSRDKVTASQEGNDSWRRKLCARRITSAVTIWKKYMSYTPGQLVHGLIARREDASADMCLFLIDDRIYERNKHTTSFERDLDDGGGMVTYTVVGRLTVGEFNHDGCVVFSVWRHEFYEKLLGDDARLKIRFVEGCFI